MEKKKYLAFYETEWPANIAELTAIENKPFVGYLKGEGCKFTVIPEQVPDNEIWYTSSDGNVVTPYRTNAFGANIVSNTYEDGKGVIKFDNSVTSIGGSAFSYRSSLTSIIIPNNVTNIGSNALFLTSLASIVIPDGVTSIGGSAFRNCSYLASVTIGNGVTSIGLRAFENTPLTSVTIPNSVVNIGSMAFYWCKGLTSLTIGNSVTSIGEGAFSSCSSLDTIYVEATTPPTLESSSNLSSVTAVYVPAESVDLYKTAIGWSYYADKIQPIV